MRTTVDEKRMELAAAVRAACRKHDLSAALTAQLENYVAHHQPPCAALECVLRGGEPALGWPGGTLEAVLAALRDAAPGGCHGTPESYERWVAKRRPERRAR